MKHHRLDTSEITSNVTIQMTIYFNAFFSMFYAFVSVGMISNKMINYYYVSELQYILLVPAFVIWSLGEVSRHFFGYYGNLKERVPQMSAFILLTVFPQFPCVLFFTFYQEHRFAFDYVAGWIMFLTLLLELGLGSRALNTLINRQTAQFFRVCQEEELREAFSTGHTKQT